MRPPFWKSHRSIAEMKRFAPPTNPHGPRRGATTYAGAYYDNLCEKLAPIWRLGHKGLKNMNKIPAKLLSELKLQFNAELGAAHSYRALSLWCEDQNLKGFARFFAKQVTEEQEHAEKLATHLIDRGALPELVAIPAPKLQFKSLLEVAQQAQAMEQNNTHGVNTAY